MLPQCLCGTFETLEHSMFPPLGGSTNANEGKEQDIYIHIFIYIGLIMTVVQIYRWKCNRFNEAKKLWGSPIKTPRRFSRHVCH